MNILLYRYIMIMILNQD